MFSVQPVSFFLSHLFRRPCLSFGLCIVSETKTNHHFTSKSDTKSVRGSMRSRNVCSLPLKLGLIIPWCGHAEGSGWLVSRHGQLRHQRRSDNTNSNVMSTIDALQSTSFQRALHRDTGSSARPCCRGLRHNGSASLMKRARRLPCLSLRPIKDSTEHDTRHTGLP